MFHQVVYDDQAVFLFAYAEIYCNDLAILKKGIGHLADESSRMYE